MRKKKFTLAIPEGAWQETGPRDNPASRLSISCVDLSIAGMSMHLEAIEVTESLAEGLSPVSPEFFHELDAVFTLRGGDCPDTVTICGREYVLVAYPVG